MSADRTEFEVMFPIPEFVKWNGSTYVSNFSASLKDAKVESLFAAVGYQYKWEGFQAGLAHAREEAMANVAKIDQLMLEFCPERMTSAQLEEWGKRQRRVSPERAAAIDAAMEGK